MTEVAWLIEFPTKGSRVGYWGKTIQGVGVTTEHMDAIRFLRKEDAEAVIVAHALEAKPVEHMWTNGAKDYLQPEPYDIEAGRILRGHTKIGCHCRYCKGVLSGRITLQRIERGEK